MRRSVKSDRRKATIESGKFSLFFLVMTIGTSVDFLLKTLPIACLSAALIFNFSVRFASTKQRGRPSRSAPPAFRLVNPPPDKGALDTLSSPSNSLSLNQRASSRSNSSPLRLSERPVSLEIVWTFAWLCFFTWSTDVLPTWSGFFASAFHARSCP